MAMVVTQTQIMAEDDDTRVETDDTMETDDTVSLGVGSEEYMDGFDALVPCKDKKLVQMTLFGTVVKKLASKAIKVKVRSHLRRKSSTTSAKRKVKEQVKVKCVEKKVLKRKKQLKKRLESQQCANSTVVNDPGLADMVQLMEQIKFDDMMELRDRLFQIRLP